MPEHGRYVAFMYTGVYGPCTRLFTACTDTVHDRTLPEHGHVHGRVPCTRSSLRPVYTALNVPCTRLCTGRVPYTAVYRAHGRIYGLCTRPLPCTDLVHGHARTVYIPMNSRVHGQRPCTRCVHGEHGRERPSTLSVNTPVNTVHGRVDRP